MAPCFGVNEVLQVKIESLKKIISSGESITVEFKESKKKKIRMCMIPYAHF